jgi:hypothetical protein
MIEKIKQRIKKYIIMANPSAQMVYIEHPIIGILNNYWGHNKSVEMKMPIDNLENPLPWFTYPAIEYLTQLNLQAMTVLEWGLGNSTLFFSKRCFHITSIEHDPVWFDKIRIQLPKNVDAKLLDEKDYVNYPLELNKEFDLIIVDGILRKDCLDLAIKILKKTGIIIFDNSDRNPELCKQIRDKEFLQIDFHGFGPINFYTWTTTIFYKCNFSPAPLGNQPIIPFGGGY